MKLIKLNAIDSTNNFLKGLANNQILENFTVVSAEKQTQGKGQMGSRWESEPNKNLIMSILIKDFILEVKGMFDLNIMVSISIIKALKTFNIPELSIKWPNDIMSANKKIGGILIENSIKSHGIITSIVGVGLNVNQTNFEQLPKASSLKLICNSNFDKEEILLAILEQIEQNSSNWNDISDKFWKDYNNILFRKGIPMPFFEKGKQNFMGIINGVDDYGKLKINLEDDSIKYFDIKEIEMLY